MNFLKNNINFSKLTIYLSSICVVHCMATPFVIILLPAIATFFTKTIENILVLSVIPLSLVGFIPTWLRHKNYRLLYLYILSIALILFSQFVLHVHHGHAAGDTIPLITWARMGVMITGAILLAGVVFKNNRHTHYCTHCDHHQKTVPPGTDAHHDENLSV